MTGEVAAGDRLHRFVATTLVAGRELGQRIPPCWADHPGVAEELSTLAELYRAASNPAEQLAFDDALERVLNRIRSQYPTGKCLEKREHQTARPWPAGVIPAESSGGR